MTGTVITAQEALKQLNGVADQVQSDLEDGITLTRDTYLKVYKSKIDEVVDPVSAVLSIQRCENLRRRKGRCGHCRFKSTCIY